nr:MAG TPA: hypothetical protein [Caudoviricetes sp.]
MLSLKWCDNKGVRIMGILDDIDSAASLVPLLAVLTGTRFTRRATQRTLHTLSV